MRMLLSGRLAPAIHDALDIAGLTVELIDGEPTQADIDRSDAWCGNEPPPGVDLSGLIWVHAAAAGPDPIVAALQDSPGVVLTRSVGLMPERAAAHAVAAWLHDALGFPTMAAHQRDKRWDPSVVDVTELTVAVLGTGTLGTALARTLETLGVRVVGINSSGRPADHFAATAALGTPQSLPEATRELLGTVDAVVSTLPGTAGTRGIVADEFLGALDGAYLVNVGRGSTLDVEALRRALDAGHVRGATLDVFETEPLPQDSWLWDDERIRITPHQAAITTAGDVVEAIERTWREMRDGEPLSLQVDLTRGY